MPSTATNRLQGLTTSVAVKAPVKAVSTTNLTLSGEQTVGGVAVVTDDRVLVKNQTNPVQNGVYLVSTGLWTRASDFDGALDVVKGTLVTVGTNGTSGIYYRVTSNNPTIDTDAIEFELVGGQLTQAILGAILYPQTEEEADALVDPEDFSFPPGDLRRYGAAIDDATDDTAALQAAVSTGHRVLPWKGVMRISGAITISTEDVEIAGFGKNISAIRQISDDVNGIVVTADGAYLHDLEVLGINQTGATDVRAIEVRGANDVTIERVKCKDVTGDAGIRIGYLSDGNDPSETRATNCRVIDCDIENVEGPGAEGIGIEIIGAINCKVRGNTTKGTKRYGIRIVGAIGAIVTENHITDFADRSGDAGINISAGTIPGPALTESSHCIVANNRLEMSADRAAGTYMGVQILGAKRSKVTGNIITLSDTAGASTDLRAIDVQGDTGIDAEDCHISDNIIDGDDLNIGVLLGSGVKNIKVGLNTVNGFVTYGVRSTGTDSTGEIIGNTLVVGGAAATSISKSSGGTGNIVAWGNTSDADNNFPFVSGSSALDGSLGRYTRVVTRSSNSLEIADHVPHPIETGDRVQFSSTGTLPSGLSAATDYWAIRVDNDTFQVATTFANASAGTAQALSDAGSGVHSVTVMRGTWANVAR